MGKIDVVVKGYVKGEPHEIETYEGSRLESGSWDKVKRTYRIFEIYAVEAIEGASKTEFEGMRVLVYPRTDEQLDESGLSSYEQMLLLEGGKGDSGLPGHLEIYGTLEQVNKKSLPFAGRINAWKVVSLEQTGPQYRTKKEEGKLELLQKKE